MDNEPVPPGQLNAAIDHDLELICLKCLHKDPARRYAGAGQLADELRRYLDCRPLLHTRPVGRAEKGARWCRRNPTLSAVGAVAAVAVLLVFAGLLHYALEVVPRERAQGARVRKAHGETAGLLVDHGLALSERGEAHAGLLWLQRGLRAAADGEDADLGRVARLNLAAWGRQVRPLQGYYRLPRDVLTAALSPDGKALVVGSADGAVRRYDLTADETGGEPFLQLDRVNALAFSPDGTTLATASGNFEKPPTVREPGLHLWDMSTGECLWGAAPSEAVLSVAFSPDGKTLLAGTANGRALLCAAATGGVLRDFAHRAGGPPAAILIRSVAFSADGATCLTQSVVRTRAKAFTQVFHWDAAGGRLLDPSPEYADAPSALAFRDGKPLLALASGADATLYDAVTGQQVFAAVAHGGTVARLAFGPGARTLLTGGKDGVARLWEADTARPLGTPLPHAGAATVLAFGPEGKTLLVATADRTARLWGEAPGQTNGLVLEHKYQLVRALAVSPDGHALLTVTEDVGRKWTAPIEETRSEVRLWDKVEGQFVSRRVPVEGIPQGVAFSPDGQTFVTGSGVAGEKKEGRVPLRSTVQCWNTVSLQPAGPPLNHERWRQTGFVSSLTFNRDGTMLATRSTSGDKVCTWSRSGERLNELSPNGGRVEALAFSPNSETLATAGADGMVRLWNASQALAIGQPLGHADEVYALAFSPDGRTLATASGGHQPTGRKAELHQWDVATGQSRYRKPAHAGLVRAIAYSPDGRLVLTGSFDGTARFWDAASGAPVGPALPHRPQVWAAAFDPASPTAYTAGLDGNVRGWHLPPAALAGSEEFARLWAEALTGLELKGDGGLTVGPLDPEVWRQRRASLRGQRTTPSAYP